MKIEMDTFHPAATEVHLTHAEVIGIAMNMKVGDKEIILRYMAMDYDVPVAEYVEESVQGLIHQGRVVRI